MSVYEKDLMPALAREMGDTDTSNLYFSPSQLFSAINDGLAQFNVDVPDQQYTVIGSGDNAYFSPDPGEEEKRLIVLYATLCLTSGEIQKAARVAYSHSNPAGRTDLTQIPKMLSMQAERIESKIQDVLSGRSRVLVETELDESGSELKGRPTEAAEGLGITIIEKTV
jgi:hypothetical protein